MFRTKFVQKIKTHILCWITFISKIIPCIACWIPKTTDTHSAYVIFIAFPLQQLLHESAWLLCYTYNTCRVANLVNWSTLLTLEVHPISSVLFPVVHGLKLQGMWSHCHSNCRSNRREACTAQWRLSKWVHELAWFWQTWEVNLCGLFSGFLKTEMKPKILLAFINFVSNWDTINF